MTDNEIIKILEYCTTDGWCSNCPHEKKCIEDEITKLALDLINRQKAEIEKTNEQFHYLDIECERLEKANETQKAEIERLKNGYYWVEELVIQSAKTEAVKEFAERLKSGEYKEEYAEHLCYMVDNLVKEMAGEN